MDLDNLEHFRELDSENMIKHINNLPDQLQDAWELGQSLDLPKWEGIQNVLAAGMGGSAIGADLLNAYGQDKFKTPFIVHRDYDLPAWANGKNTLVICSSHSGNTEETLSAFDAAAKAGCRILVLTTGGKLAERAKEAGAVLWQFKYDSQPRAAIGYSFGLLLAAASRLGLLPDPSEDLADTVSAMKTQQKILVPESPVVKNSSKRMAGQFYGRWITIYGAGILAPVARRWKTQLNEVSKSMAGFEVLPEAGHNTLEGVYQPEKEFGRSMFVWLRAPSNHPRNNLRDEFTRIATMVQGINTDFIMAQGEGALANMWTCLHYGDYTSYYLAMAYEVDPTPVPMLSELKENMSNAEK